MAANGTLRLHLHVLEAVERHVGDHGEARVQREGERSTQRTSIPLMPASVISQIKPATRAAAAGDGRPWKKRLSTTAGVHVEAGQAQRGAGAVHKSAYPAPAPQAGRGPRRRRSAPARRRKTPCPRASPSARRKRFACWSCGRRGRPGCRAPWRKTRRCAAWSKRPFMAITMA